MIRSCIPLLTSADNLDISSLVLHLACLVRSLAQLLHQLFTSGGRQGFSHSVTESNITLININLSANLLYLPLMDFGVNCCCYKC